MNINNKRNFGIDLLRIVSMQMIIILHVLGCGGILSKTSPFTLNYEIAWFLEILSYCAVNCYALISGYVGVNSKFKCSNIIILWFQVVFYSFVFTIFFFFLMPGTVSIREIFQAFFPVMTTQYWYFTAYFCMFFFIPLFNYILNNLPKKQLKYLICLGVVLFSVLPTLFRSDAFGLSGGYSFLWLSFLYIIGGYIKKHNPLRSIKKYYFIYKCQHRNVHF